MLKTYLMFFRAQLALNVAIGVSLYRSCLTKKETSLNVCIAQYVRQFQNKESIYIIKYLKTEICSWYFAKRHIQAKFPVCIRTELEGGTYFNATCVSQW